MTYSYTSPIIHSQRAQSKSRAMMLSQAPRIDEDCNVSICSTIQSTSILGAFDRKVYVLFHTRADLYKKIVDGREVSKDAHLYVCVTYKVGDSLGHFACHMRRGLLLLGAHNCRDTQY